MQQLTWTSWWCRFEPRPFIYDNMITIISETILSRRPVIRWDLLMWCLVPCMPCSCANVDDRNMLLGNACIFVANWRDKAKEGTSYTSEEWPGEWRGWGVISGSRWLNCRALLLRLDSTCAAETGWTTGQNYMKCSFVAGWQQQWA